MEKFNRKFIGIKSGDSGPGHFLKLIDRLEENKSAWRFVEDRVFEDILCIDPWVYAEYYREFILNSGNKLKFVEIEINEIGELASVNRFRSLFYNFPNRSDQLQYCTSLDFDDLKVGWTVNIPDTFVKFEEIMSGSWKFFELTNLMSGETYSEGFDMFERLLYPGDRVFRLMQDSLRDLIAYDIFADRDEMEKRILYEKLNEYLTIK